MYKRGSGGNGWSPVYNLCSKKSAILLSYMGLKYDETGWRQIENTQYLVEPQSRREATILATRPIVVPWYIKKGVRQMSGREYWWVSKALMPAWEIPRTVSRTKGRKQLQMLEQELSIQPEVSRSSWSRRKK